METKTLNYTAEKINQRLNLAGTAVQPNALSDYYTKTVIDSMVVVDLSVRYATSYANLSAALTALNSDTATDAAAIKKAGVSIKFINSSTNKYEQWSLKASSWSVDVSDWGNINVTQASEVVYNGQSLSDILPPLDNISKQNTQFKEQAIIYETDGGVQVGKIDANGADFVNLKRGGQQVARMLDLPTLDTSIGSSPSDSHTPSTKAVKDYVDANVMGDLPISEETTQLGNEEFVVSNDAGTDIYASAGSYGIKARAYLNLNGVPISGKGGNIIVVDIKGSGDYTSLQDAMDNAGDTSLSPKTIIILPGKYEMPTHYGADLAKAANRYLSIIGTDKNNCILYNTRGDYRAGMSVDNACIQIAGNVYIANLTIISTSEDYVEGENTRKMSYCVHFDFSAPSNTVCEINNCVLINDHFCCIGIGLRTNYTIKIVNCELNSTIQEAEGWSTIYCHDGNGASNQKLMVSNCVITSNRKALIVSTPYNGTVNVVLINNVCQSTGFTKNSNTVLSELCFGNNVENMNYSN